MIRQSLVSIRALSKGFAGASLIAITAGGLTFPAFAQDAAADDEAGLGEIIVTARKVAENLQDVPVAVTTFSGDDLKVQGATSFRDVAAFTPGFVTREAAANSSAPLLALRGQFQNDNLATLGSLCWYLC